MCGKGENTRGAGGDAWWEQAGIDLTGDKVMATATVTADVDADKDGREQQRGRNRKTLGMRQRQIIVKRSKTK